MKGLKPSQALKAIEKGKSLEIRYKDTWKDIIPGKGYRGAVVEDIINGAIVRVKNKKETSTLAFVHEEDFIHPGGEIEYFKIMVLFSYNDKGEVIRGSENIEIAEHYKREK